MKSSVMMLIEKFRYKFIMTLQSENLLGKVYDLKADSLAWRLDDLFHCDFLQN